MKYTITLEDSTVLTGSGTGFYYQGQWISIMCTDTQGDNHWEVGENNTAKIFISGYEKDVSITITESPVLKATVEPISIIENMNGYYNTDVQNNKYFYYSNYTSNFKYRIEMKDGNVFEGVGQSFQYNGNWESLSVLRDNQASVHWTAGNTYDVTLVVCGYKVNTQVTIVESPVESIQIASFTVAEGTKCSERPDGSYYYHLNEIVSYRLKMKNESDIIRNNGDSFEYNGTWIHPNFNASQPWYAGNTYEVTISVLGAQATFTVTIEETNQADGFTYMLQDGNAIITGSSKTDAVLNIPSTIDGHIVIGITDLTQAMQYAEELVIPDSVTMLSSSLFQYNSQLKKLTLGKGISNINNEMFFYTDALEEIEVSSENPTYTSVDGVVYDKEVTKLVVFPVNKTGKYVVPNTVTNID